MTEVITDIRTRIDLEIRRIFLVRVVLVRIMDNTVVVLVTGLQMPHVILAAKAYLNGQTVEEAVAVCHIERMVLVDAVESRIIGI